jgi:hypothetical protein
MRSLSVAAGSTPDAETSEDQHDKLQSGSSTRQDEQQPVASNLTRLSELSNYSQDTPDKTSTKFKVAQNPVSTKDNIHDRSLQLWQPALIRPDLFYRGRSCFHQHWIENGSAGFPSLLLNWDSFNIMFRLAYSVRRYNAATASYTKTKEEYSGYRLHFEELNKLYYKELRELHRSIMQDTSSDELYLRRQTCLKNIEENEALINDLRMYESQLDSEQRCDTLAFQKSQGEILPLLEDLFEQLGTLPAADDIDGPIPVAVMQSVPKEDGADMLEWPENTWNNTHKHYSPELTGNATQDPGQETPHDDSEATWNNAWYNYVQDDSIETLRWDVKVARKEADQAKFAFDNFRDDYYTELQNYLFRFHGNHYDHAEAADTEDKFGPLWFKQSQDMTKRLIQAEKKLEETQTRLKNTVLAASTLDKDANVDKSEANLSTLVKAVDADDVRQFGRHVSSRKRRHIDDWLNTESAQKKRRALNDFRKTDSSFSLSEISSCPSESRYAQGEQRQMIDEYVQHTQQVWLASKTTYGGGRAPKTRK